MPHSVFLGRVVGPDDPTWLPTDRGYALAWHQDRAETCRCGTRPDEWAEDGQAYIGAHRRCPGCATLAEEQQNVTDDEGRPRPGFHTFLVPRDVYFASPEAFTADHD